MFRGSLVKAALSSLSRASHLKANREIQYFLPHALLGAVDLRAYERLDVWCALFSQRSFILASRPLLRPSQRSLKRRNDGSSSSTAAFSGIERFHRRANRFFDSFAFEVRQWFNGVHSVYPGKTQRAALRPPMLLLRISFDRGGYAVALCACLHNAVNPAGSLTARSARILRSSSMPAFFSPLMNTL